MQRYIITTILLISFWSNLLANNANDTTNARIDYHPHISGVVRARYELRPDEGDYRFQVRTARVRLTGNVSERIDYLAEVDLCDRGDIKTTDIWGRLTITNWLKFQAGQMRMPFSFGSATGPHMYLFADRPFVDKQFISPRNFGAKAIIAFPGEYATLEAGVYNGDSNAKQTSWQKSHSAAFKLLIEKKQTTLILGGETLITGAVRTQNYDIGAKWRSRHLFLQGEYISRHYGMGEIKNAHAYEITADYTFFLKPRLFDSFSIQSRFDGMSKYSNGNLNDNGLLELTEPRHQRLTLGTTFGRHLTATYALLRLNYEHYFNSLHVRRNYGFDNKFVAELVIRF